MDKRNLQLANAFNKAIAFYKANGFMDFTRFKKYFDKIDYADNEQRLHHLINLYQMFSKTVIK